MRSVRRRGFTLIEVLVVSIVLAIIGALIVPRIAGKSAITAQLGAEQMASMLATFAFRSTLADQPVALIRDGDSGAVEVWVLDINPDRPDLPADWRLDRFSKPLRLPDGVSLSDIRIDGQRLMPDAWRIVATPGVPRPRIEVAITTEEEGDEVIVVLEPRVSSPYFIHAGGTTAVGRVSIDLDREGREKELW